MVQIELTMQNGAQIDWPMLAVPLMLDAGADASEPRSCRKLVPARAGIVR